MMLGQLVEFINNLSIDEKLYWRVGEVEIFWRRAERPKPWSMKMRGEETARGFSTNEFLKTILEEKVDLADFERQLGVSVLTQAVFADMIMGAARQLFGDEVVTKSIADTRAFLSSVTQMAQTHGGTPAPAAPKPGLRLVRDKLH